MRIGDVIGNVVLGSADPKLIGGRLLIVQPHDPGSLRQATAEQPWESSSEPLVVYDEMGAGLGERVGFSEGREATMPFYPDNVAIDAYVVCLLDKVTYDD